MDVSTPSSPKYGQYWTKDAVNEYLAPSFTNFELIFEWLRFHNIHDFDVSASRFIKVKTSIEKAESLLSVDFKNYVHMESGYSLYRSLEYYKVPRVISNIIEFIGGVNRFPSMLIIYYYYLYGLFYNYYFYRNAKKDYTCSWFN